MSMIRHAYMPYSRVSFVGSVDTIGKSKSVKSSLTGRVGAVSTSKKVNENIPLQWAVSFKNFIHSGTAKEFEAGGDSRNPDIGRSPVDIGTNYGWNPRNTNVETVDPNLNSVLNSRTNFGRSLLDGNADIGMNSGWNPRNIKFENGRSTAEGSGSSGFYGYSFPQVNVEQNADIVHIKILRNNTFITVTDSNGNKKFGSSSGKLTDKGGKVSRYASEAIAEQIGRDARGRGIKSVVVKVNGFTYFKKKKQAILSLREGYSYSRGDKNPVVYIEDTTRRPHNGCRLRKKRRV